jgi:hypothetical protein
MSTFGHGVPEPDRLPVAPDRPCGRPESVLDRQQDARRLPALDVLAVRNQHVDVRVVLEGGEPRDRAGREGLEDLEVRPQQRHRPVAPARGGVAEVGGEVDLLEELVECGLDEVRHASNIRSLPAVDGRHLSGRGTRSDQH